MAVDTSVLLSIFKGEPNGEKWLKCLYTTSETKKLLVSMVVVSEIRSFFPSDRHCQKTLEEIDLHASEMTEEGAFLAGSIFRSYRSAGGSRKIILPDFLVAAHAATQAESLATEDRGYLRAYFPSIRIIHF